MQRSIAARLAAGGFLGISSLILGGCGGGAAPAPAPAPMAGGAPAAPAATPAAPGSAPAAPAETGGAAAPATASNQSPPQSVDPQRKETRWLGKIPYDVFYDRPLTIASDQTPLAGGTAVAAAGNTTATPMPMVKPMAPDAKPAEGASTGDGKFDLGKLTSVDALVEESKQSRQRLTAGLQKLGDFNKNFKDVSAEAAILAAISAAVGQHPEAGKPNWKDKAKYVRDLSKEISSKASDKGSERFNACKDAFEKICEMLDGGKGPGGDAADAVPYSDVTTLSDIMWRFQKTFDYLKLNINDEKRFKDEKPAVERETMVFNMLAGIMATQGYEYLDDEEYMQFHKKLTEGTAGAAAAVSSDDFAKFRMSLNSIQQAMDECHPKYRTGG